MDLGPRPQLSFDSFGHGGRIKNLKRGGRDAGRAASVQAKLCGRLPQSWPWSSVAAGLLAQRAIQRGPPTAPRRPRRGRPVPKPVQERTPRLPPLSDDVWKPEPVAEEEVLLATKVDGQSLKDVAAEVWRGGRVLFTKRWSDLLKVRKALNVIAKERVQVSAGMDDSAVLRERRRLIRDAARRLFVRVQRNGELCVEGGPVLGYVPVMYSHHDGPPLAFRANDVTALNVAWQFFVNGLDYSFLPHTLHPFFGVYFTLSPTEHFQLLRDWLKTYKPSSNCRALDLGTGSGVISFLLRHHFDATMSIVASDRCPNAVFSVQAELERHEGAQNITVKRGDLFDGLKEEPFDLIIFNPPWVPQPPGRTELPGDVVMGNDYPPELFERLFSDVPEVLKPNGRLLVLFSNYAQCRGLVKRSPMEDGARMLQLEEVQRRVVEEQDRNKHRQTRRDKSWSFKEKHQVELWVFTKKSPPASSAAAYHLALSHPLPLLAPL